MPDDSKTIGTIGIDSDGDSSIREPIFIALSSYRNKKYLDIRKFFLSNEDWKPTKKGITLQQDQIKELIDILKNNAEIIEEWFSRE